MNHACLLSVSFLACRVRGPQNCHVRGKLQALDEVTGKKVNRKLSSTDGFDVMTGVLQSLLA